MSSLYDRAKRSLASLSRGKRNVSQKDEDSLFASASSSGPGATTAEDQKKKPPQPHRVGFIGIARDRSLLVWARDATPTAGAAFATGEAGDAAVLGERLAALGRKVAARPDPPGWDDLTETGADRALARGGGAIRCVKLPVHDLDGATSYVVAFGAGYPAAKAQALCERLALMLGPMVDIHLGADLGDESGRASSSSRGDDDAAAATSSKDEAADDATQKPGGRRRDADDQKKGFATKTRKKKRLGPDGAADLRGVLEREIEAANSRAALDKVANQVEEVRAIMERNVEMILDRGEKLDALEAKSDALSEATLAFKKQARKLKRWHLMNQVKWGVTVGTIVTASVAIPVVILAAA